MSSDSIGATLLMVVGGGVMLAFCIAVIYAIFQVGRYFKKKADKQ